MKKVLILTVTAGNGHNSCAYAMKDKLMQQPDVEVKIVDIVRQYSSKLNAWITDSGYSLAVAHFLTFYNIGYERYRREKPENRYKCSAQGIACTIMKGLYEEIWDFQPDVIYATHFYGSLAVTNLKLACVIPAKTVVACLDYVNSPFWEGAIGVDYMTLPTQDFVEVFQSRGFRPEQLLVTGMPVRESFYNYMSKAAAREKLGLEPDKFTVLIMFGGGLWSGGHKMFNQLINVLDFPAQVIKINGKDKKGYRLIQKRLDKNKFPQNVNVTNIAFTTEVATYMAAADIVISKMGGPSATECINSRTPVVVTTKLAKQEVYNFRYLHEKGCACSFRDQNELGQQVHRLQSDPGELFKMECACDKLRTDGIGNVSKLILEQPNAVYNYADKIPSDILMRTVKRAMKQAHRQSKAQARR